jgi:tetratricopeptide (TPR) repeat protein
MSIFDKLFKSKATPASAPQTEPAAPARAPDRVDFNLIFARGVAAASARDLERAVQLFDDAIKINPSSAEAHYKRANALKDLGRLEEAVDGYNAAIARKADYAYAYCNRGSVQQHLGLLDDAVSSYDQAIALDPTDALAHYNRALLMQELFQWDEALASYDRSLAANPEFADAQFNRAMALLFTGRFEAGWPAFESRWKNAARLNIGAVRNFKQPLWLGEESISGKTLLLHSEQGLGDTLQFCRYATACANQGATVLLEAQPPLLGLLSSLEGVAQLIPKGNALPAFDYHCPLLSLPLAFKTTLESIPAAPKYLRADPDRVLQWRAALGESRRPRVGLVWSGNPNNQLDATRSIRLADWVEHLPPELDYFRLQRDVRPEDEATLEESTIFSYDDDLLDFTSTAALCECMDVVISVDTSIAHLSGALGQRTWVLLPFTPDWRWMRDRTDSPWYPSVRLYRQPSAGDWKAVFTRVADDLRRQIAASASPWTITVRG